MQNMQRSGIAEYGAETERIRSNKSEMIKEEFVWEKGKDGRSGKTGKTETNKRSRKMKRRSSRGKQNWVKGQSKPVF